MDFLVVIVLITLVGSAICLQFGAAAETEVDPVTVPPPPSVPREFLSGEWS